MAIWWRSHLALLMLVLTAAVIHPHRLAAAAVGQLYWCDVRTGFAIGGYDPVAYFVDSKPRLGDGDFEYDWQGVTWRFVSAANRAVFVRDPKVYAPQFGGYGAESLAMGVLAEGSPLNWLIYEDRLFLFATNAQRAKWRGKSAVRRGRAGSNWPKLNGVLVRE